MKSVGAVFAHFDEAAVWASRTSADVSGWTFVLITPVGPGDGYRAEVMDIEQARLSPRREPDR